MINLILKVFSVLAGILSREVEKHDKHAMHLKGKARNHRIRQDIAIGKMRDAGAVYRNSLYNDADKHAKAADAAQKLHSKIRGILE